MKPNWTEGTRIIYQGSRTNYEKFNIRFNSAKRWSYIKENLKQKGQACFKSILTEGIIVRTINQ